MVSENSNYRKIILYIHSSGKIKKSDDPRVGKDVKQKKSHPVLVKMQIGIFTLGKFGSTYKDKHAHTSWPGNSTFMYICGLCE